MALARSWEIGFICLWTLVFTLGTNGQDKAGLYLSVEDVLLLKDEPNPKCFTRTWDGIAKDFTCFFETLDNTAYDFYYTNDNPPRRTRCEMTVQKSEHGAFLHICSFPPLDIFTFVEIPLEVMHRNKSTILYSLAVSVEDNILLDPPSNISIKQNDHTGQLQVSWQAKCAFKMYYKIRYSSKSLSEKIKQGHNKLSETLVDLVPGEEVKVQVTVRCSPSKNTGHWSHWSNPVHAVVPQTADDISLMCHTRDLLDIKCQWDSSRYSVETDYSLFYKMGISDVFGWIQWTQCFPKTNLTGQCSFHGDKYKKVRVKLSSPSAQLNRTFYSQDFTLNNIIKTSSPSRLKQNETDKFCMFWEPPLASLSSHLQYEVCYRVTGESQWMTVSSNGPETAVCLKLPGSSQFSVKVRAKPHGPVYSGHWSDWSDVLIGDVPAHSTSPVMLLVQCSPVMVLVLAVIFISLFSRYFSELKKYFWPPVPNLDKVLQEFLTDLNQHKWDPPLTAKQCFEETTASIVEVTSKDDDSGLEEPSEESAGLLSSSDTSYSSVGQEDESTGTDLCPDYVALNRNSLIQNCYVYEHVSDKRDGKENDELLQNIPSSFDDSLSSEHLGSDFLNHSYLPPATVSVDSKDTAQRGHGNIYTNLPCC